MRHVFFEGLHRGHEVTHKDLFDIADELLEADRGDLTTVIFPQSYLDSNCVIDYEDFTLEGILNLNPDQEVDVAAYLPTHIQLSVMGAMSHGSGKISGDFVDSGIPTRLYQGTLRGKKVDEPAHIIHENNGHLGILDNPKMADRLWGTFVYNPHPDPNP